MDINCTTEEILDITLVVIRNPNNFQMDINFTTAEILNMIDGKWISIAQQKRY